MSESMSACRPKSRNAQETPRSREGEEPFHPRTCREIVSAAPMHSKPRRCTYVAASPSRMYRILSKGRAASRRSTTRDGPATGAILNIMNGLQLVNRHGTRRFHRNVPLFCMKKSGYLRPKNHGTHTKHFDPRHAQRCLRPHRRRRGRVGPSAAHPHTVPSSVRHMPHDEVQILRTGAASDARTWTMGADEVAPGRRSDRGCVAHSA